MQKAFQFLRRRASGAPELWSYGTMHGEMCGRRAGKIVTLESPAARVPVPNGRLEATLKV
jgi:hypothetical protein